MVYILVLFNPMDLSQSLIHLFETHFEASQGKRVVTRRKIYHRGSCPFWPPWLRHCVYECFASHIVERPVGVCKIKTSGCLGFLLCIQASAISGGVAGTFMFTEGCLTLGNPGNSQAPTRSIVSIASCSWWPHASTCM